MMVTQRSDGDTGKLFLIFQHHTCQTQLCTSAHNYCVQEKSGENILLLSENTTFFAAFKNSGAVKQGTLTQTIH